SFASPTPQKLVFQVECVILDLINIPYVSGFYFAKWRLRSSGAKGLTQRATVSDHVVTWNSSAVFEAGMYVGKDNVLQQCELQIQEVNGGKSSEDVGSAVINLAECAGSRTTSRRLLLQDSRVNSVLRVTVNMKLLKGDPIYGVLVRPKSP
ncbi:EEIG1/EHBP1 N-terminal domain-containing protein, partial [Zopfochytrium polystomum]